MQVYISANAGIEIEQRIPSPAEYDIEFRYFIYFCTLRTYIRSVRLHEFLNFKCTASNNATA